MNTEELSNAFDTYVNAFNVRSGFGEQDRLVFDEYEKSLFLTQAQDEIVVGLYTGRYIGKSFEETEELRKYLKSLVNSVTLRESLDNPDTFVLPDNVLFITHESVRFNDCDTGCINGDSIEVIPVKQDEINRVLKNPFKRPNKRKVLRVDSGRNTVELISDYKIDSYTVWYLSKPTPIILVDTDEVSIDGYTGINECKLDSILHRPILERAVELAVKSKSVR